MSTRRTLAIGAVVFAVGLSACGRDKNDSASTTTAAPGGATTSTLANKCGSEAKKATEVGVTADTITVTVVADATILGTRPLFQGNLDGMNAWAKYVNANGGVGCRQVVVKTVDSQISDAKTNDGYITACKDSVALVGGNSLFSTKAADLAKCVDIAGAATGLPDIAQLANDVNEQCNTTTYSIQAISNTCPITPGVRDITAMNGTNNWLIKNNPGLHGQFVVPGDLPSTRQSAPPLLKAAEAAGIKWDSIVLASQSTTQPGYDKFIAQLKSDKSNYVYDGSDDNTMINYRKEAIAQGAADQVKVWGCSLACYTRNFLKVGGSAVEGTYTWLQFLPFEEADTNPDLKAYVDATGLDNVSSWGAQAWMAGQAFKEAVDTIVDKDGPNAITRKAILAQLATMKDFDSNGWMGKKDLRGQSSCYVIMQVKGGKFVRAYPEKKGTLQCDDNAWVTVKVDPVAEAAKFK